MIDYSDFKFEMQSKMPGYRAFENSKHSDAAFMDLCRGTIKRLIHSRPSQHGKSSDTDLVIAYMYGLNPLLKAICATYSQHLARRHSRNVKRLLQSPEFFEVFGWRPSYLKETEDEWQLNWPGVGQGSSFLARSIESPALGETADLLVIDDPLAGSLAALSEQKQMRAWESISNVLMQRLTPGAKVLVISTLWTQQDPSIKLMEQWRASKTPSSYLNLAAVNPDGRASFRQDIVTGETTYIEPYEVLWPEWRDFDFIETKRLEMLPEDFETQYQGNPVAGGGSLAPLNCWGEYEEAAGAGVCLPCVRHRHGAGEAQRPLDHPRLRCRNRRLRLRHWREGGAMDDEGAPLELLRPVRLRRAKGDALFQPGRGQGQGSPLDI